jgi:DNA-binding CsgD family transcriptional regulator/tetratricopeptide (TPR) repeat protein
LIARQRELQQLDACLASARSGHAAIALLRGEAGMGKSRLAESLAEQARGAGVFVATGHCTPVSGGELPFGPFVEILSQIDTAPGGSERVAGATWDLLRTALTVSGSSPGVAPPDVGLARSRLFTSVLWLLHHLGQQQPVVLVLEDVHWADASSLDLLNYLARTAAREQLMLLLTCRDDGLARDPGTRKAIRDLSRADLTRDIHLKPLTGEQIRELLAAAGCELTKERYDRVVQLADGNPFMALELAAHDAAEGTHTEALRHALLGPVDDLSDGARSTLHVAAVLGESVPQEVLEKAVQSTGGDVGAHLRVLTQNGLLVASEEHYAFRHAIVRESVVQEMLHGERTAAHRGAAEGVRLSQVGATPAGLAQLAHHLVAAEEYPAALPVVMSAAESARRVYAFAEARRQLSVARSVLWSRVEDPEGLSGSSSEELLRREAEMARWAGEPSAAADLLRSGLSSAPRAALAQSRLELELGEALWAAGDPAGALAACERAETALEQHPGTVAPAQGPSAQVLHVRVLAALAQALNATGSYERGQETAEHALALARECGATRTALQARITLATATARRGDLDTGVAELHRCLAEALSADAFKAVVRCYGNLAFLHSAAGQPRQVLQVAEEGEHTCRRFGPLLLVAPTFAENWVHALVATGRWDEAVAKAQELEQQWVAEGMALTLHLPLALVAAARGDEEGLAVQLAVIDRFARTDDPYTLHDGTVARAEHLLWQGDAQGAHRVAREALEQLEDQQDAGLVISLCGVALRAHADLVASRADRLIREAARRETADLLDVAQHAAEKDPGALGHAHLLVCRAEAARASMTPSADAWGAVVAEWQRLECPYPAAYAQWRQATELFGARARAQGTNALLAALETATALRCTPLELSLRTLARLAGVTPEPLDAAPTEPAAQSTDAPAPSPLVAPLTPRENDVLRMLTRGFTNQQIARRLFITESTVSVHVSHIIAKLGVSNRLQAAAAAQRLNLLPPEREQV